MKLPRVVLILALAAPASALADGSGGPSTIPSCIWLVGLDTSFHTDPIGACTVAYRDMANNPIPDADVRIDFSNCVDLMLAPQSDQTWPGMTIDCTGRAAHAFTNASGVASFSIVGAANNPTGGTLPKSTIGCASITADNQPLGLANVSAFNEDGTAGPGKGVGGNDASAWKGDFFTAGNPYFGRSDFDCNNSIGGNDLSVWLGVYFAAHSLNGPAGYCP
jgi:hypothetical protein